MGHTYTKILFVAYLDSNLIGCPKHYLGTLN